MKYMTFNSSCSYAGLANMLEQFGIDTTDRDIALGMNLPYLFSCCDGAYLAGPMLQEAQWFDLYLNPMGFRLVEEAIAAENVADYLKLQKTAMLGISTENAGKHAVVYTATASERLVFLNNKRDFEDSPDEIYLTEEELKQKIEPKTVVATLQPITPKSVCFTDKLQMSISVLQMNLSEIIKVCYKEACVDHLRGKLNTLFRALLLDGITMLHLIGETELAQSFERLQCGLLSALRQNPDQCIYLKDYLSTQKLQESVDKYISLIQSIITGCRKTTVVSLPDRR